ncbi:MAG: Uma2 family endonuclease [Bacteroidetes bacterium]|jgi:Uma2 family endonuclease|nr:Uma2 family endonuclease [Bacteroidota bacterium]
MDTQTRPDTAWHRALHDERLQDLPYRVETNEHGQILLSPHKPRHSFTQTRLVLLLDRHLADRAGSPVVGFAVATAKGVKVPDVVWISDERAQQIPEDAEASPVMPDLVIEVLSATNTEAEMAEKRALYVEEGAREVWLVGEDGAVRCFDADGSLDASDLAPSFPGEV